MKMKMIAIRLMISSPRVKPKPKGEAMKMKMIAIRLMISSPRVKL